MGPLNPIQAHTTSPLAIVLCDTSLFALAVCGKWELQHLFGKGSYCYDVCTSEEVFGSEGLVTDVGYMQLECER